MAREIFFDLLRIILCLAGNIHDHRMARWRNVHSGKIVPHQGNALGHQTRMPRAANAEFDRF